MQKTKFGLSIGAFGALLYFSGLFSGYLLTVILAGYTLFYEENPWLKRTAVKAVSLLIFFSLAGSIIGLLPGTVDVLDRLFAIFTLNFHASLLLRIVTFLQSAVSLLGDIVFLVAGFKAFSQGNLRVPIVDSLTDRMFN